MKEKLKNNVGADDPTVYDESVRRNVGAGDYARPQKRNTQSGITLIALIISIIVMLILAVVSINIIINQGIITKSQDASNTHNIAAEKEAIELAYSKYLTEKYNGETTPTLTITDANATVTGNEESGWTITYANGNVYTLSKDGGIQGPIQEKNEETLTDEEMQAALQSFTANPQNYVHPEQSSTNKDRAIGTDGKAVNMDLWKYMVDEENSEITLAESFDGSDGLPGYSNNDIVDGKIKGKIPQYLYKEEENKVYTVTSMVYTFAGCTNLKQAPAIPNSVINMFGTFAMCDNLTQATVIPNSVANMLGTFIGCISLNQAPEIPNSVTNMQATFAGCINLKQAPEIPNSVTNMDSTFAGCTNLTQAPKIPSSVTNMSHTFEGCTILTQAPEIPNSVTDMGSTFSGCTSLTGTVIINASNINIVYYCFDNITNNITVQVPANSTTYNNFNSSYGSSSNITIETF